MPSQKMLLKIERGKRIKNTSDTAIPDWSLTEDFWVEVSWVARGKGPRLSSSEARVANTDQGLQKERTFAHEIVANQ